MKAPHGISSVYGMSGRSYMVDELGIVVVSADDAKPLRQSGFVDA